MSKQKSDSLVAQGHQQQHQQHQLGELMAAGQNQEAGRGKRQSSPPQAMAPLPARGPALNFSIESIMNNTSHSLAREHVLHHRNRPADATSARAASPRKGHNKRRHTADKGFRSGKRHRLASPDETKRAHVSRSSSPAADEQTDRDDDDEEAEEEEEDEDADDDDEVRSRRTSLSGSSNLTCGVNSSRASSSRCSSRASSRASTPISPGCNSVSSQQAGAALIDQHHFQQQHEHRPQQQQQHSSHNNNSNNSNSTSRHHHHHHSRSKHQKQQHQYAQQQQTTTTAASARAAPASSAPADAPANPDSNARLNQVECVLDNKDMWDKFHSLNTEMIITKTGRRMFPVMKVQFHNLDPSARYAVSMDIVPVDNKRYRYAYHKSCWQVAGKADPSAEPRLYAHPDSPFNGDLLARQVISFEKVKLTNNEADKTGHIILNSMHKYQPRVHLIELKQTPAPVAALPLAGAKLAAAAGDPYASNQYQYSNSGATNTTTNNNNTSHRQQYGSSKQQQAAAAAAAAAAPQLDIEGYRTFVFPETVFTAVTAYQNQLITKMKIDKNPFAKGFRDSSRLSDLDRGDPFDYMGGPLGSLGGGGPPGAGRGFPGLPGCTTPGGSAGPPGSLDAATAAMAAAAAAAAAAGLPGSNPMDAYQLLANNPWYSAAAVAAAAGQAAATNPFGAACSTAQAAQQLQTQMWLATLSACLGGGGGGGPVPGIGGNLSGHGTPTAGPPPISGPDNQHHDMKHQTTS